MRRRVFNVVTVLAICAMLYLGTYVVCEAAEPAEQWMTVVCSNAGGGDEFPPEATVRYQIDLHNESDTANWVTLTDTLFHTFVGDTLRYSFDIPKDGTHYEFRTFALVDWGDGAVETGPVCYSGWVLARRVENPPSACGWLPR